MHKKGMNKINGYFSLHPQNRRPLATQAILYLLHLCTI